LKRGRDQARENEVELPKRVEKREKTSFSTVMGLV